MSKVTIFSIIVPVYEDWHLVPSLINKLDQQTLDKIKFEVILVDNGSDVFLEPSYLPQNVKILKCSSAGSYAARNYAVKHAKGVWLVFTDADCLPRNNWLEILLDKINNTENKETIFAGAIQMKSDSEYPSIYEMYDMVKGIPQEWYVKRGYAVTANLTVSATLLKRLGGFNRFRYSGGDAEFTRSAVLQGAKLYYVGNAIVEHPTRKSWKTIATKARRVKGGQLTSGTARDRNLWLVRTFTPPVIAFIRFLSNRNQPLLYRLAAVVVQFKVWFVEVYEAYNLMVRKRRPERR